MRLSALAVATCLALSLPAAAEPETGPEAGWTQTRDPMPFDIIRSLQFLQDQVARGNDRAIRVQALLLRRFGPVFLDADAEVWTDPRNLRAAVLFVLSGGPPDVLAGLIHAGAVPEARLPLFEGALAYVRNDLARAGPLLAGVDLREEEPGLAGHIHLVLGQILQNDDPAGAAEHLDQARLLAPGGLIEEAALRLQALIVEGLGDHARADRLARQYFDRYEASSYSANFEARFSTIQSQRGVGDPDAAIAAMDEIIAGLPAARRATIYLAVGRRALVEGHLAFARVCAERAGAIEGLGESDADRARLYEVASSLSVLPAAEARSMIESLSQDRLDPSDAELLSAARKVVDAISEPSGEGRQSRGITMAAVDEASSDPGDPAEPAVSAVISRAERILGETIPERRSATP